MWRSRPIFISGTFEDMEAERDYLRSHVFPELEERLRGRRHYLEWVDLRVGVATAGQAEENTRELQVLKVCLAEVRRCRPFLIVLIGDRYGWVPPPERIKAAAAEEGFDADVAGRSVTDLEIEFGVLSDPEQRQRGFFYIRDPLQYAQMPPAIAASYADICATDPQAAERVGRLAALKQRIGTALPRRVRRYHADWDAKRQRVTGIEAWGRMVLDDVWAELEAETAGAALESEIPWQQAERNALEDFADERARDFVGRHEILQQLTEHACAPSDATAAWGLCVTGELGSGKGALFGALYRQLKQTDAFVLAHASRASLQSGSVDRMLRRWIDELAAALAAEPGLAADANPETVETTFVTLLGRMAGQRRVAVLVDSLDRFEATTRGRYATWLPRLWPANARFLATAIPGESTAALAERTGIRLLPLPPLERGEASAIAEGICARYHRALEPPVLDALLARSRDGALAWGKPLWLVLAVEELNLLDADDFARAKRAYSGAPAERLRALMLDIAAALPADIPGLYGASFDHAEELFGAGLARAFLGLIAVSRAGWRESDFRALLPRASGETWDGLRFAALRRLFRGQLRPSGALGQWDFSYGQMRDAALLRLEPAGAAELHGMIADHLLACAPDDPLRQSEAMVHLLGSENAPRAAAYYGSETLSKAELEGATRAMADAMLAPSTSGAAAARLGQLIDAAGLDPATSGRIANRFLFDLDGALAGRSGLQSRIQLMDGTGEALARLLAADASNPACQRDLWACHARLGELLMAAGSREQALTHFGRSLAIADSCATQSGLAEWYRSCAASCANIASALVAAGRDAEALPVYERALAIDEKLCAAEPDNVEWQRDLSVTLNKIGELHVACGRRAEALAAYRKDLAIAERLVACDPDNWERLRDLSVSQECVAELLAAGGERDRALAIYLDARATRQKLAARDPGNTLSHRDLWVIHAKIGDLHGGAGRYEEALACHRKAQAIMFKLANADSGNAQWQRDLAATCNNIGDALTGLGRATDASAAYQSALTIAQRLAAADSANVVWQRDLSLSFLKTAAVSVVERPHDAVANYRKALAIAQRLAATDPQNRRWRRDLSMIRYKVGDALIAAGQREEALVEFQQAIAISQELAAVDPANMEWQRDLALGYGRVGDVLARMSRWGEAVARYRMSHAIFQRLAAGDAANIVAQGDVARSSQQLRQALISGGHGEELLDSCRRELAIAEQRAAANPGNRDFDRELAEASSRLGDALTSLGRRAEALAAYQKSMSIREKLASSSRSPSGTTVEEAK